MELTVGGFIVRGQVHRSVARASPFRRLPDPAAMLRVLAQEERRFLSVTAATIRYLPNARYDTRAPVALVSVRHLDSWAPAPEPSHDEGAPAPPALG